jgi:3-deoxy-manno-octulosonate cytidylyltransferase (CMP-KDO synthetase)
VPDYAVLIPARYASTRLPGKPLLRETGKYLVQHTYERAALAPGAPRVVVLTDDDRVEAAVKSFGGEVLRTRADHASGTDRCAEAAARLPERVVVNLQGDEPTVAPGDLARLAGAAADPAVDLATLAHPFDDPRRRAEPSAVKALVGPGGRALDFVREDPSPQRLAALGRPRVLHHVGLYGYRVERLLAFAALPPSPREVAERLEQLRALENGWRVRVLDASGPAFGVDTPADYAAFVALVRRGAGASPPRGTPASGSG